MIQLTNDYKAITEETASPNTSLAQKYNVPKTRKELERNM